MTRSVSIRISAKLEVAEAEDWYEARQPDLGLEFRAAVFDAVDRIADNPLMYPVLVAGNRRFVMKRFPYNIWYRVSETEVVVMAVIHGRRGRRHFRERLGSGA